MKLSDLKTDLDKARNGVWETYIDDFKVKVARSTTPGYISYIQKYARGQGRAFLEGRNDPKTLKAIKPIIREAAARHLLLDWKGMEDDDGNEIPYSVEMAVKLLLDPAYDDLYRLIESISQDSALYRFEAMEDDAGNSSESSTGT